MDIIHDDEDSFDSSTQRDIELNGETVSTDGYLSCKR